MTAPTPGTEQQPPAEGQQPPVQEQPAAPPAFDRNQLHPALREMSPTEMTDLFETMATTIRTVQARGAERDLSGVPEHARTPEPPKKPTPLTKDEYKEMLDPNSEKFDPEVAFRRFAETNYGGLVGDINARAIRATYGHFRGQFPDFSEYESDVNTALQNMDPATLTDQHVLTAYLTAKGLRMTLKERQERASKSATTQPPSPPTDGTKKEIELSEVEQEIAHKMFRRIKDPQERLNEYRKFAAMDAEGGEGSSGFTVKVPVGGGKKE